MSTSDSELSAVRSQILSNVGIAFPVICGMTPNLGANNQAYTIVTRVNTQVMANAMIMYDNGPLYSRTGTNKIFRETVWCDSVEDALHRLMVVTSSLIDSLFERGDIKESDMAHEGENVEVGGGWCVWEPGV